MQYYLYIYNPTLLLIMQILRYYHDFKRRVMYLRTSIYIQIVF